MNSCCCRDLCLSVIFGEEIASEHTEFHIKRSDSRRREAVALLAFAAFFGQLVSSGAVGDCVHVIRVAGTRCQNISETVKFCERVYKCIASPMKHEALMETTQC